MGWHEWAGVATAAMIVGIPLVLFAIGGLSAALGQKKADGNAPKEGSA